MLISFETDVEHSPRVLQQHLVRSCWYAFLHLSILALLLIPSRRIAEVLTGWCDSPTAMYGGFNSSLFFDKAKGRIALPWPSWQCLNLSRIRLISSTDPKTIRRLSLCCRCTRENTAP